MAAATMNTIMEAVDFNPDDDDLMEEDAGPEPLPVPAPRVRSTIAVGGPLRTKGRGFREEDSRLAGAGRPDSDPLASDGGPGPVRSIEGWIILVTGVHEDAPEDDLHSVFADFGQVKNLHMNLNRRTGYVKGYALIEYANFEEAQAAIQNLDGTAFFERTINVEWAFSNGPVAPARHRSTQRRKFTNWFDRTLSQRNMV